MIFFVVKTKRRLLLHDRICPPSREVSSKMWIAYTAPWFGDNRRRRNPTDCRHCGGHFASVSMLRSHAENAHGLVICLPVTRGTHTCPVCGKTFVELRYLRQHMEKHGEERFVCEKCGQRSRWASTMVRHRRKCTFKPANVLK